jgi:hypothetical protein
MITMRALHLDYQRSNTPVPWPGWGLLVAALAVMVMLGGHYQAINRKVAYWESRLELAERLSSKRETVSHPLTEQEAQAQLLEVAQANQVVRQLSHPWNSLFLAVEESGGEGIALLSLEPDPHKGMVMIGGEAKDLEALLTFVRQLTSREVFGNVFLRNHEIQQADPQKPLRFSLLAEWTGVAP